MICKHACLKGKINTGELFILDKSVLSGLPCHKVRNAYSSNSRRVGNLILLAKQSFVMGLGCYNVM